MARRKNKNAPAQHNDGWEMIQKWTTRISKWNAWKKALLAMVCYILLLTLYTMFTFEKDREGR